MPVCASMRRIARKSLMLWTLRSASTLWTPCFPERPCHRTTTGVAFERLGLGCRGPSSLPSRDSVDANPLPARAGRSRRAPSKVPRAGARSLNRPSRRLVPCASASRPPTRSPYSKRFNNDKTRPVRFIRGLAPRRGNSRSCTDQYGGTDGVPLPIRRACQPF